MNTFIYYQLIHLLDFLPAASLNLHTDDSFLRIFSAVNAILTRAGKMRCKNDFDATESQHSSTGPLAVSLGSLVRTVVPSAILLRMSKKAMGKFSAQIGHSLDCELHLQANAGGLRLKTLWSAL